MTHGLSSIEKLEKVRDHVGLVQEHLEGITSIISLGYVMRKGRIMPLDETQIDHRIHQVGELLGVERELKQRLNYLAVQNIET